MSYDHANQYRCTIVRGKAYKDLDNLLMIYASAISEICPCSQNDFVIEFNKRISNNINDLKTDKTLNNHRTEIAGKLFGMYYIDREGMVNCSPRVYKLLEDSDQPAYFKELLLKYQFPSGMSKITTVAEQLKINIRIRQFPYIVKLLKIANDEKIKITKDDIGYYVLNNLDVLTSKANPKEVLNQIILDKKNNIKREIKNPGKANSYSKQHIREQINLLVLANIVYYEGEFLILNLREDRFIKILTEIDHKKIFFDFYQYNLTNSQSRIDAEYDWDLYFSKSSNIESDEFTTSATALIKSKNSSASLLKSSDKIDTSTDTSTVDIGDEGELYVYNFEVNRVKNINQRLTNRIKLLGKIRGLGYDIHSVYAEGKNSDFAKYIEVKSTKRVTLPESNFIDSINLTKNEWSAAQQHREHYYIYRLYFTNDGVKIFVINNPCEKYTQGSIMVEAIAYRAEFNQHSGSYL
jgi:hypothetical protein